MKKNTKHLLVAGGLAAGAAVVIGTILLWPKKASAQTNPPLPLELDSVLTAQQKADVGMLLNNSNDPEKLAQAGWNYEKAFNAPIASELLAKKARGLISASLDANYPQGDLDILYALYVSTDPIELGGMAAKLQTAGYPKAAQLVANRARFVSGL